MHSPVWMLLHRSLPSALDVPELYLQNQSTSASQTSLRRLQNRRPEGLKSTLGGSKIEPRSPWGLRGPPGAPQERPKSAPRATKERHKTAPERPWTLKRDYKMPNRAKNTSPKGPQGSPREAQEGLQDLF